MTEILTMLQSSTTMTMTKAVIIALSACLLGLLVSLVYIFTSKKTGLTRGFALTLVVVTTMTAIVVMFVGNNVATAFSLAGVFTLVRYRSEQTSPKDLAFIFVCMGIGLTCGIGYIHYSLLFAVLLSAVIIILTALNFGDGGTVGMNLKIVVPEDMEMPDPFEDVLSEYTKSYRLVRIRSTDFGSMVELMFAVRLDKNVDRKELMDKLRARNGNMPVTFSFDVPKEK